METIIIAVVAFVFGWVAGGLVTTIKQAQAFQQILKDLGVTTEQLLALKRRIDQPRTEPEDQPAQTLEIRLEQHAGQIYAYRKDNSQFLAQGTDRDELIEHLKITFANGGAHLIIREADGAALVK